MGRKEGRIPPADRRGTEPWRIPEKVPYTGCGPELSWLPRQTAAHTRFHGPGILRRHSGFSVGGERSALRCTVISGGSESSSTAVAAKAHRRASTNFGSCPVGSGSGRTGSSRWIRASRRPGPAGGSGLSSTASPGYATARPTRLCWSTFPSGFSRLPRPFFDVFVQRSRCCQTAFGRRAASRWGGSAVTFQCESAGSLHFPRESEPALRPRCGFVGSPSWRCVRSLNRARYEPEPGIDGECLSGV